MMGRQPGIPSTWKERLTLPSPESPLLVPLDSTEKVLLGVAGEDRKGSTALWKCMELLTSSFLAVPGTPPFLQICFSSRVWPAELGVGASVATVGPDGWLSWGLRLGGARETEAGSRGLLPAEVVFLQLTPIRVMGL